MSQKYDELRGDDESQAAWRAAMTDLFAEKDTNTDHVYFAVTVTQ